MISIGTLHDDERRILEPLTSSIQDRIIALQKCADAGLKTAVFFGPVYPTTTVDEIPRFLDKMKDVGVQELWIDMLRLKPGILENVQKTLQADPGINQRSSKLWQNPMEHYRSIREETQKRGKERYLRIIDAF
jgi:DNA repair photolyase